MKIGLLIVALATTALPLMAQSLGTAFTYQGSLKKNGSAVQAAQDFQFGLYGSAAGSDQIGTTVTLANVGVLDGLFSVNLDFGEGAFGADQRFLQIMVRPSGETAYTGLAPRAAVMPAPVALSVAAGGVGNAAIQDGAITRSKLAPSVTPKLLMWLPSDMMIFGSPVFPWFISDGYSNDLMLTPNGVMVNTAGTYVVSTRLTLYMDFGGDFVNAFIRLNGVTLRSLSNGLIAGGTTVLSSVEILQLQAGDFLSVDISSFAPLLTLKGDGDRSTTFDIVRID